MFILQSNVTSDLSCFTRVSYVPLAKAPQGSFHRGEGSLLLCVHLVSLITWHMLLPATTAARDRLTVWLFCEEWGFSPQCTPSSSIFPPFLLCTCSLWTWISNGEGQVTTVYSPPLLLLPPFCGSIQGLWSGGRLAFTSSHRCHRRPGIIQLLCMYAQ